MTLNPLRPFAATAGSAPPAPPRADDIEALMRAHRALALRMARKYLHDSSSADDVVQQAFLVIIEALPRYEERGTFAAYLCAVLRNLCRMDNRALGARTRLLTRYGLQGREAVAADADRESLLALRGAMLNLSDPLRQVLELRYGLGLSHGEIAERLTAPVGTVRRRTFDALRRLLAHLGGQRAG